MPRLLLSNHDYSGKAKRNSANVIASGGRLPRTGRVGLILGLNARLSLCPEVLPPKLHLRSGRRSKKHWPP